MAEVKDTKLSDLSDVSIDDIENKIMVVLYSTMDVQFTKFSLYDKLIIDQYNITNNSFIHQNFKANYLLILRHLRSKYDDIVITDDGKIYCTFNKDEKETEKVEEYVSKEIIGEFDVNLSKYIIDNAIEKEFEYVDPFNGNTIYHDLVLSNNFDSIKKMIDREHFEYFVFNKNNKTPLELSTNPLITNIIVNGVYAKILKDNKKYNDLLHFFHELNSEETYVKTIEDCHICEFLNIKLKKIYAKNKTYFKIFILFFVIYIVFL